MNDGHVRYPRVPRAAVRLLCSLFVTIVGAATALADLTLHTEPSSRFDLEVTGRLTGVPAGQSRYIRWADLRALPTKTLTLSGEFVPGAQQVTALFVRDFWAQLPKTDGADTLLAACTDGYASIYREELFAGLQPFFVLEINGRGPESWPPEGLIFNPGPYVITISAALAPAVGTLLDANHKRPWGVTKVEVANFAERTQPVYTGRWGTLSVRAREGREIWINSCASCHNGPGDTFGGTKGDRPFDLLALHARDRPDFLKLYVRAPKSVRPDSKMDAHPHYTDAHLEALVAFITAEPPPPAVAVAPPAAPPAREIRNRDELVAFVTATLKTWETNDARAFLNAFAADAVFAYPGGRLAKDALEAMFADLHQRKTDVKIYVGPFIVAANEFAVRYQFACTDRVTGKRQAVGTGVRGTLRSGWR